MPRLALIQFLDGNDGGHYPDNSLPGPIFPLPPQIDNTLPPSQGGAVTLPVFPFDPSIPSNELPPVPPVTTWPPRPGMKFRVVWLACKGLILVPDNSLPPTPEPK